MAEPWTDGRGILLNTFSGAVDVVSSELVAEVKGAAQLSADHPRREYLVSRGYYVDSPEIEDAFAREWGRRAKAKALQIGRPKYMFGLTLKCNLSCSYCWQVIEHGNARQRTPIMSESMADAAFAWIDADLQRRGQREATISLFGGEPLLDTPGARRLVNQVGARAQARGHQLHFTTNGKTLAAYRDEIRRFGPSIQVTVDGVRFDSDRVTLQRAGVDLVDVFKTLREILAEGSAFLFLRFLVTRATAADFAKLAERIFQLPEFQRNFVLSVAPIQNKSEEVNPEIPPKFQVLMDLMVALAGRPYAHRVSFLDWRSLQLFAGFREGVSMLPEPTFYHCEANTDLTCFDSEGLLYACYEAIGDPKMAIGRYWPTIEIDAGHEAKYRQRSAFSMPQCSNCAVSPICGGGCEVRGAKKSPPEHAPRLVSISTRGRTIDQTPTASTPASAGGVAVEDEGLPQYLLPYCDDLHAETALVLQRWQEIFPMLVGPNAPARI